MKTKREIIDFIASANISLDDWHVDIKGMLPSEFAKGYYTAKLETLEAQLGSDDEAFRDRLTDLIERIA